MSEGSRMCENDVNVVTADLTVFLFFSFLFISFLFLPGGVDPSLIGQL